MSSGTLFFAGLLCIAQAYRKMNDVESCLAGGLESSWNACKSKLPADISADSLETCAASSGESVISSMKDCMAAEAGITGDSDCYVVDPSHFRGGGANLAALAKGLPFFKCEKDQIEALNCFTDCQETVPDNVKSAIQTCGRKQFSSGNMRCFIDALQSGKK